jgi:hypothetical protein
MNSQTVADVNGNENFYSLFNKNFLPSYDFFRLFFAKLSKIGVTVVDRDKLYSFLQYIKEENATEYQELLQDVSFRYNGIFCVSKDIEANLNTLQTLGAIGRSNPKYELLLNYFSSESADKILSKYSQYEDAVNGLAETYRNYKG